MATAGRPTSPHELAKLFDRSEKSGVRELVGHKKKVHTVGWNLDGRRLASGSHDNLIMIWHIGSKSQEREHEFSGHTEQVDQIMWDPTSADVLASASVDRTVRIWDARAKKCQGKVETKDKNINISFSPDGNTIAVGSQEDTVSFIDKRTRTISSTHAFKQEINEISWNNTNNLFFLTTGNGFVEVYDYPGKFTDEKLLSLEAHTQNCYCIKFDPKDNYFAVGSADALVSIWDASHMVCVRTISRLDWPVRTLGFSHDGRYLASGSEDHFVDVADIETGEQVYKITSAPDGSKIVASMSLAWHPRQHILAMSCERDDPRGGDRAGDCLQLVGF